MHPRVVVVVVVAVLLSLAVVAALVAASPSKSTSRKPTSPKEQDDDDEKEQFASVEVLWDTWGVPHIFSSTEEGLAYGIGYAHARDQTLLVLRQYGVANGRASELNGAGIRDFWLNLDLNTYANRVPQVARDYYEFQHPSSILKYEAFAAGFNDYVDEHPDEFYDNPELEPWNQLLPLDPVGVCVMNWRIVSTFCLGGARDMQYPSTEDWPEDPLRATREKEGVHYSAYLPFEPMAYSEVPEELKGVVGSNGWAINSNSGRSDGSAKVVMNPHMPYFLFFRWYEAHFYCEECGLNLYGVTLVGIPGLEIAYNDYLGWTHTVNPIQPYTGYELELADENSYYYDGEIMDIETEEITFKVKLVGEDRYREETIINEFSHHGQIINRSDGRALAIRVAGIDNEVRPDALYEWWELGRSHNLDEFRDAMRLLQIPIFYTVMATRDGDIMNSFNGWVPDRNGVGSRSYWSRAVPGNTSETFWDTVHPWDDLPRLENPESGFLQNANEGPYTTTLPIRTLDPANYPDYMAPQPSLRGGSSYRPQASTRLISSEHDITYERLIELKHDCLKESSNHALDDLLEAILEYGSEDPDLMEAHRVLSSWDRKTDTDSVGAVLFSEWIYDAPSDSDFYVVQWDEEDPLTTPHTLRDPQRAVDDLSAVIQRLQLRNISVSARWGDVNRMRVGDWNDVGSYVPGNGCFDCFRNTYYVLDFANGGDTWVAVVEFNADGPRAKGLLTYGNATPGSRGARMGHHNDQPVLYTNKQLRDLWRDRDIIEQNLEEAAYLEYSYKLH